MHALYLNFGEDLPPSAVTKTIPGDFNNAIIILSRKWLK